MACAAAITVLASIAGLALGGTDARAGDATGPNIIVVMSDDQAPEMMRALPTVQREIGKRGATFTNAFASFPLCCPARATFLTGEYAHNHGTKGNNRRSGGGYQAMLDKDRNLAAWLQADGYETAFAGKWLNGVRTPHHAPPGWDRWSGLVGEGGEGLSSFYDFDIFEPDGSPAHYGTATRDYQTDVLTRDYALPFIDEQAAVPGPYFLWLAYHPPHFGVGRDDLAGRRCSDGPPDDRSGRQSAIPPVRYARFFAHAAVPRPPSFDERDVSDKPKFVRRRPPLSPAELELIDRDYRCGLAALLALDDGVGEIVDHLAAGGELANTVLVFLTDQGVMSGEHRIKRGKNRPYEEAIDIPLLIAGPSILPGQTIDAPVVNADIAPTLLNLAGATIPPELDRPLDGTSLAAVLAGAEPNVGRAVLIEGRDGVNRAKRGFKVRSYVGAHRAMRTSSTGAPATRREAPGYGRRSAPAGRPSASSTTSGATPTSCAAGPVLPPIRPLGGSSRPWSRSSSFAAARSACSPPRCPGPRLRPGTGAESARAVLKAPVEASPPGLKPCADRPDTRSDVRHR